MPQNKKSFEFEELEQVTVWRKIRFDVIAENYEEAKELAIQAMQSTDVYNDDERIMQISSDIDRSSEEEILGAQNCHTRELASIGKECLIWTNKKRLAILNTNIY